MSVASLISWASPIRRAAAAALALALMGDVERYPESITLLPPVDDAPAATPLPARFTDRHVVAATASGANPGTLVNPAARNGSPSLPGSSGTIAPAGASQASRSKLDGEVVLAVEPNLAPPVFPTSRTYSAAPPHGIEARLSQLEPPSAAAPILDGAYSPDDVAADSVEQIPPAPRAGLGDATAPTGPPNLGPLDPLPTPEVLRGGAGCCPSDNDPATCFANPPRSFPSTVHDAELQRLVVDVARRMLLSVHPYAADEPIITLAVNVRPSGHAVHGYVRLQWQRRHWWQKAESAKTYVSEISASLLYHPDRRRLYDISYVDNAWLPFRNVDTASQVIATFNEEFALRDETGAPVRVLSERLDVLEPYVKPRAINYGPIVEPDPRARSLRTVRRDSNVTANQ